MTTKRDFLFFALTSLGALELAKNTTFFDNPFKREPEFSLNEFGGASGQVTPFKQGTYSDIYFGAFVYSHALELGIKCPNLPQFLTWSAGLQTEHGFFDKVCKSADLVNTKFLTCGRADSHDATLSKWLELFELQPMDAKYLNLFAPQVKKAKEALFSLKRKNGLFGVFPQSEKGYENYCLFKDNIEVLRYFKIKSKSDTSYVGHYTDLLSAIQENFGKDLLHPDRLAIGANYKTEQFYPHKVAAPFVILENVSPGIAAHFDWDKWIAQNKEAWILQTRVDYPWGLVALAALLSNRSDIARSWLYRVYDIPHNRPKPNVKWNVLEELSVFVIRNKLGI